MSEQVTAGRKGRESYSSVKLHQKRDRKRAEADARQLKYDDLTKAQKLERLPVGGESKREIARLNKAFMTQKSPAVKQAPLTEVQKSVKAIKRAQDSVK